MEDVTLLAANSNAMISFQNKDDVRDVTEVVMLCCAIKAITGWHVNLVSNLGRERCGGAGYLSANR